MHIHVNDFQVQQVVSPLRAPPPACSRWAWTTRTSRRSEIDANGTATAPSSLTLRSEFIEYTGTYVIHCHRLNHEDNGLMVTINVIPEVSTYAVAVPGPREAGNGSGAGRQRGLAGGLRLPVPVFEGTPSVAMADVNGDMILDLIVGTGKGVDAEVVAYDGNDTGRGLFKTELTRFARSTRDSPAVGDRRGRRHRRKRDGGQHHRRLGSGHRVAGEGVRVDVPAESGKAPDVFSTFTPYPDRSPALPQCHRNGRIRIGSREHRHRPAPVMPRWSRRSDWTSSPRRRGRRPMARRHGTRRQAQ